MDILQVIYTLEFGQLIADFPINEFPFESWVSKENLQSELEQRLKTYWQIRPLSQETLIKDKYQNQKGKLELWKISTCFKSDREYPFENTDWNGKFYYENGKILIEEA